MDNSIDLSEKLKSCLGDVEKAFVNIRGDYCCSCKRRYSIVPTLNWRIPDEQTPPQIYKEINKGLIIYGLMVFYDVTSSIKIERVREFVKFIN